MSKRTTYLFAVNDDGTITPSRHNGKAVTWDAQERQFTVCKGRYVVEFVPGKGLNEITGITFTGANRPPIQVMTSKMIDSADVLGGPWEFTISWGDFYGGGGSTDPKIYNDGTPPPTL